MGARDVPAHGQLVEVRRRQFVVTNVEASTLPPDPLRGGPKELQHLVTLSSVEDDALGEELQVVWELEPGARAHERMNLPDPAAGFDDPTRLDAFLDAVRWGAVSSADVRSLQAPFRSGITIEDYQLEPVVRALQMPRVNLLVADDVGLGKTVESGLVAQELILRHRVRSILVVCPAPLQIHWRDQMRDRFGLEFRIVDSTLMKTLRRSRGLHVNPWTHFPRLITSVDFVKRERPMRLFREVLPAEGEPTYPRRFDLLIVDEAHNVAPQGSGNYATDSQRTDAIRALAPHFEHRLFLTATPHNGYPESFSALLELLDDQRFARGVPPAREQLAAVMVRRMKGELKLRWDGSRRFAERKIEAIEVPWTPDEKRVHQALREYTRLRRDAARDDVERFATEFVLKVLKKRLFSSPAAFAATLEQHERSLITARRAGPAAPPPVGVLRRMAEGLDDEASNDEDYEDSLGDVVDTATRLFHEPTAAERDLLTTMREYARKAQAGPDTKARELLRWIDAHLRTAGKWNDNRVIIFTEYRATQKWLQGLFAAHGLAKDDRLMLLFGGMQTDARERIKAAFQAAPDVSPVRVLLATDAASEGIDLQNHCSLLIHYEIPWNPNRMEQRNGRIDRHGQRAAEVLVHHFVGAGYRARLAKNEDVPPGELEGDLEFLMKAVRKVEQIREDLGKVGPVIAAQVEEAMLGRRGFLDTSRAERDGEQVRRMLKFERQLRETLSKCYEQLKETERDLHLSPENIRAIVSIGLALAGKPPLREATVEGLWPAPPGRPGDCPVFQVPPLDGSWAPCLEGLAHPHTGALRPIVFDNAVAAGRDDVVLAHLNHRLVRMCLQLLRAEVWSREDSRGLRRVTARLVPDSALDVPAVVAHARLVILGGDSQRLHEEVFFAGGTIREGRFARFPSLTEMSRVLNAAEPRDVPEPVRAKLAELWPRIADPLLQSLEVRKNERAAGLQSSLRDRAAKEAADIKAILEDLDRTIRRELAAPAVQQLEMWSEPERMQLERNTSSLHARLDRIPAEIAHEQANILARFADPKPRMFPVAVTFLVPRRLAHM